MRRFLACLLVAGAGAAFAQTPTTYTNAGTAVVAAIEGLTPVQLVDLMTTWTDYYGTQGFKLPVTWIEGASEYTGHIVFPNRPNEFAPMLNAVMTYFYEADCQTLNRFDCSGLAADPKRATNTAFDDWYDWHVPELVLVAAQVPSCPESGEAVAFGPVGDQYLWQGGVEVERYRSAVMIYPPAYGSSNPCEIRWGVQRNAGSGWLPESSNVPGWQNDSFGSAIAYRQNQINLWVNNGASTVRGRPRPNLFRDGTYRHFGEDAPVVHNDMEDGLRTVLAEIFAELERVNGYAALPAGVVWDPMPTEEQLGAIEPPGEPSEPDPSDPGDCEEGWYLTRVVCEIRTAVENTWTFISHDAWVPEEDWGEAFAGVRDAFEARIWYLSGDAEYWGIPSADDLEEIDHFTHAWCAVELDLGLNLVGPFMPGSISEEPLTGEFPWGANGSLVNWCMTPPAQWLAGTGRDLLGWFLVAGFVVTLFGVVTGRA